MLTRSSMGSQLGNLDGACLKHEQIAERGPGCTTFVHKLVSKALNGIYLR